MKKIVTLMTLATLSQATVAHAYDATASVGMSVLAPFFTTGYTTYGALSKQMVAATEDLQYFVASEGQIRTAKLESVLAATKASFNTQSASDLQIAEAILADLEIK